GAGEATTDGFLVGLEQVAGAARAPVGVLGQAAPDDGLQGGRDLPGQPALGEGGRVGVGVGPEEVVDGGVLEGAAAREHLEEEDADAVQVAPAVHVVAADLFGGDVLGGAGGGGQAPVEDLVGRDVEQGRHLGQPEVHQLDGLVRGAGVQDHQVARLEVAVDDA